MCDIDPEKEVEADLLIKIIESTPETVEGAMVEYEMYVYFQEARKRRLGKGTGIMHLQGLD